MDEPTPEIGLYPGLNEVWPLQNWPAVAADIDRRLANHSELSPANLADWRIAEVTLHLEPIPRTTERFEWEEITDFERITGIEPVDKALAYLDPTDLLRQHLIRRESQAGRDGVVTDLRAIIDNVPPDSGSYEEAMRAAADAIEHEPAAADAMVVLAFDESGVPSGEAVGGDALRRAANGLYA